MARKRRAQKSSKSLPRKKAQPVKKAAAVQTSAPADASPEWVRSYKELGEIFHCHHHSFPRWTKKHLDAPLPRQNGDHSVAAWREFFEQHPEIKLDQSAAEKLELDLRIARSKAEDIEIDLAIKKKEYRKVSEFETWLVDKIEQQKLLLSQKLKNELPPKLVGLRAPEIAGKMEPMIAEICQVLQGLVGRK